MVCKALGFVLHTRRVKIDTLVMSLCKGPCFEKYILQHFCTMCEKKKLLYNFLIAA
jgi:hypothetical protein